MILNHHDPMKMEYLSHFHHMGMDPGMGPATGCTFPGLASLRAVKGSSLRPIPSNRCQDIH